MSALTMLAAITIATACQMFAQTVWSTELLGNPGFEQGSNAVALCASGSPTVVSGTLGAGWGDNSCWDSRPHSVTYAPDTVAPHSGSQSQSVTFAGASGVAQFYSYVWLVPGQRYTASVWLRADRPLEVLLQTRGLGPPYLAYGVMVAQVDTTWKQFTFDALAPDGQSSTPGGLFVILQTAGKIWLDDASVTSVADQVGDPLPKAAVPAQFFGMHVHRDPNWPAIGNVYGSERLWDAEGVQWLDIFPADPASGAQPQWAKFDSRVDRVLAHGAEPVMVLGGNIPTWASADPSGAAGCNFYGPGTAAPPVSRAVWQDWVRAVATHAKGRVHYWEIWNEPYQCPLLANNISRLVQLAADAAAILKSVDPSNVVLSPSFPAWDNATLDRYLNAGGGAYTDVLSLHAYDTFIGNLLDGTVASQSQSGDPASVEDMFLKHRLVSNTRLVLERHGLTGVPIWNTEGGYLLSRTASGAPNDAAGAPFLARNYLVEWAAGLDRNFYYAWDQRGVAVSGGREAVEGDNNYHLTAAGEAYRQVARWLTGAVMVGRSVNPTTGTWQISLQRGPTTSVVVWNPVQSVSFTVPAGLTQSSDIAGNTVNVSNSITVGPSPVLLTPPSTTVSLTVSSASAASDQSVTFTATVSGASPSGSVQFKDGESNLGAPVTLSGDVASLTVATLSQGAHNITAVYLGDGNNLGSTSSAISQTISAALGATDADVPTLPEWGAIFLAMLLIWSILTREGHRARL